MREFTNLPPLTPDQANAVVAYLAVPEPSLLAAAEAMDFTLGQFLDLLASPNVQAHLDHAAAMARRRSELRLAEAAHAAVDALQNLAENPSADPIERRRAASTLLRAHRVPGSNRAPSPTPRLPETNGPPDPPIAARRQGASDDQPAPFCAGAPAPSQRPAGSSAPTAPSRSRAPRSSPPRVMAHDSLGRPRPPPA